MTISSRLKKFFTAQPVPAALFQVSAVAVSGIAWSRKEGRILQHAYLPLDPGVVEPSFDKLNIKNEAVLAEYLQEMINRLKIPDGDVSCLIPDLCVRVFILPMDSLPSSRKELEDILTWRIKKQIPHLPEDMRLSVDVQGGGSPRRVLAAMARASVVQEYETFFSRLRLHVRVVSVPALQLAGEAKAPSLPDVLVGNVEDDHVALAVFNGSGMSLFRSKALSHGQEKSPGNMTRQVVMEVENTLRFIEDKEKKNVGAVKLRLVVTEGDAALYETLANLLPVPVERIMPGLFPQLNPRERELYAPLIGQIH